MNFINAVKTVVTTIAKSKVVKVGLPIASLMINVAEAKAARNATIELTKKVAAEEARKIVEEALAK